MYSQQKIRLTVTVVGTNLSGNTLQYEFRVMPFSNTEIQSRIEKDIANAFESAPRFFDLNGEGVTAGSGIVDLDELFNSGLLSEDAANSTFSFTLSAAEKAPIVNLGSGVTDSGKNVVYISSGTNILSVGSLEMFGDAQVTVTGTIALDRELDGKADVTVSKSFVINLFDRPALANPNVVLTSGADANGSGLVAISNLDYDGRVPKKVTIEIFSGASTTKLATIVFEPGKSGFTTSSGVGSDTLLFSNSGVNSGLSSFIDFDSDFTAAAQAGATPQVVITIEYSYYLNSKVVAAVLVDKSTRADASTASIQ